MLSITICVSDVCCVHPPTCIAPLTRFAPTQDRTAHLGPGMPTVSAARTKLMRMLRTKHPAAQALLFLSRVERAEALDGSPVPSGSELEVSRPPLSTDRTRTSRCRVLPSVQTGRGPAGVASSPQYRPDADQPAPAPAVPDLVQPPDEHAAPSPPSLRSTARPRPRTRRYWRGRAGTERDIELFARASGRRRTTSAAAPAQLRRSSGATRAQARRGAGACARPPPFARLRTKCRLGRWPCLARSGAACRSPFLSLPSLPYKVDTFRPSFRTNWTRLVHMPPASSLTSPARPPTGPRRAGYGRAAMAGRERFES
jgi:hypothetical protein